MKNQFILAVLGTVSIISGAWAAPTTSIVPVPVSHVFAPLGFDTNDNTEVIVSGYLPNLCYKAAKTESKVSGKRIAINVKAIKTTAAFCPQMVVPFLESAQLGVMDKGKYDITVNAGLPSEAKTDIAVTESTSSAVDDFVYANVQYVERTPGVRKVTLKGENPSTCYDLDEVKFVSNGKDTYSVLPVLKKVAEVCPTVMVPFAYEVDVPTELSAKTVLLHVRIMNGKSVNALYDNM